MATLPPQGPPMGPPPADQVMADPGMPPPAMGAPAGPPMDFSALDPEAALMMIAQGVEGLITTMAQYQAALQGIAQTAAMISGPPVETLDGPAGLEPAAQMGPEAQVAPEGVPMGPEQPY